MSLVYAILLKVVPYLLSDREVIEILEEDLGFLSCETGFKPITCTIEMLGLDLSEAAVKGGMKRDLIPCPGIRSWENQE